MASTPAIMTDAKSGDTGPQLNDESHRQSTSDGSPGNRSLERSDLGRISRPKDAKNGQSTRIANVCREPSGDVIGVAVWLSATDLHAIGVTIDETEALEIRIDDGDLRLVPAGGVET